MPMIVLSSVLALLVVAFILWLINTRFPLPGNIQTLANVVLALILVGVCLWLINTYIPMAGSIKAILNIVVVVATCVKVLQAVGLWDDVINVWDRMKRRATRVGSEETENPPRVEILQPTDVGSRVRS